MKKKGLIIVTAIVCALVIGQQANARRGDASGPCWNQDDVVVGQGQDAETRKKVEAFRADTVELRKAMQVTRAMMRANMDSENPNPDKAGELAGRLFDLRTDLQAKADAAGVGDLVGAGGCQGAGTGRNGCQRNGADGGMGMGMGDGKGAGSGSAHPCWRMNQAPPPPPAEAGH